MDQCRDDPQQVSPISVYSITWKKQNLDGAPSNPLYFQRYPGFPLTPFHPGSSAWEKHEEKPELEEWIQGEKLTLCPAMKRFWI
jgi:hypothetical protein